MCLPDFIDDPELRRRDPAEFVKQRDHSAKRNHVIERERQLLLPARGHSAHPLREFVRRREQVATFAQQFLAGRCQPRTVAAPIEEQNIEVVFEAAYRVGHGRRHTGQFLRRTGEAAAAGDRIDQLEGFQGQRHHLQLN